MENHSEFISDFSIARVEAELKDLCDEIQAYRAQSATFDKDFHKATGNTWDNFITTFRSKVEKLKQTICNWDFYYIKCAHSANYEDYLACGTLHKCIAQFPMFLQ